MKKLILLIASVVFSVDILMADNERYAGGDISLLPSYEASANVYLDGNGNKITDLITWLRDECEWNSFRVRLFVNPQKLANDGKTFDPAVCQDLAYVEKLGKRIKDAGCYFMLDIHYSDTYVDATHIQSPVAWKSCTDAQKADSVYVYTKKVLEALKSYGAQPDMVQVGNEIMYGLCDIQVHPYDSSGDNWDGYLALLKNGSKAVREVCPQAQIIIHGDRPTETARNKYYYQKLIDNNVDFDVIGLSYYPFWHGTFEKFQDIKEKWNYGLTNSLNQLATDFPSKEVQIVETGYNFQHWPESANFDTQSVWACSVEGQFNFVKDLVGELNKHDNVNGVMYWCPEEAGCGNKATWTSPYTGQVMASWLNRGLWDDVNSGATPIHKVGTQTTPSLFKDFSPTPGSIKGIESAESKDYDGATFNLTGQKLDDNAKGIVIKAGKKVLKF